MQASVCYQQTLFLSYQREKEYLQKTVTYPKYNANNSKTELAFHWILLRAGEIFMNIELVKLTPEYKTQLFDMLTEWTAYMEVNHVDDSPWAIFKNDFHDFEYYMDNLEIKEETEEGWVPDTTFFCLDKEKNIFVGAVNIRHYLSEGLLKTGGHIGDGIRPSERRKGYATAMIALALEECRKIGINRVLMCCDKDNIGSVKSIIYNGGILENEVEEDGQIEQRYWIQL